MTRYAVPWIGGLLIAAVLALAGYDIYSGYQKAINDTGRELHTQARMVSEQTARSVQAVDVQLRHLVAQFHAGAFAKLSRQELKDYLQEQAVGLVQAQGLLVLRPSGEIQGSSYLPVQIEVRVNVTGEAPFEASRNERNLGLAISDAQRSSADQKWMFVMSRRLETTAGDFAGVIAARGKIEYFQDFYRDLRLDAGTNVTLMKHNGTLLARHPPVEKAYGRSYGMFHDVAARYGDGDKGPVRLVSPYDNVERFAVVHTVPGYPLSVVVTRDVDVALAPWRQQAIGTIWRTLALGALAAVLLALLARQLGRLYRTQESLQAQQERFTLAVEGSDDGIWDFDFANKRVFASARARELSGLPAGPETQSMDEWFASLPLHPDDAPKRLAAMEAHLSGKTPVYVGEWRLKQPDGEYRWRRLHGVCLRDASGKPYRMAGSITDIDMRRRAEEALRGSQERFALAVAGSNDGIVDWDVVHDRMYSSPRAMQIMGVKSDVTMRTRAEWRDLVVYHPDDAPRVVTELRAFLDGPNELRDAEYRVKVGEGEYRWIRHRNKCIRDAQGRPVRVSGSVSDIDAQKRAEEALRAREEQYKAIFNGTTDALVLRDAESRIVEVNPAFVEMSGYSREEVLGKPAWVFTPPEMAETVKAYRARALAGEAVHFEVPGRRRDGSRLDIEYHLVPIRHQGRPHYLAMARDITARKRAEEALRSSEEQYREVFNASTDGLVLRDADGRVVDVNPAFLELSGYTREEVLNQTRWFLAPREHADKAAGLFSRVTNGERVQFEVSARRQDGTPVEVEIRGVPMLYRGAPHSLGIVRDITARKRAEEELRASEEQYRGIFDATADALVLRDADMRITDVNPAFLEMSGYTREEVIGETRMIFVKPEDTPYGEQTFARALAGEHMRYEVRGKRKDGTPFDLEIRSIPIRYRGRPHLLGIGRDITAQKRAEAERARLEGQLLQAKKLEAIGTLAGGIAHDFNNILAAILGYGEMAQKAAPEGSPLRRHVDAVVNAGMRAKSLVARILAFSRSGIGERVAVHVEAVVGEALDLFAASLPFNVKLVRRFAAGDAAVMGDPTQIHQVVMNLCANALQSMKAIGRLTVFLDVVDKKESMAATSPLVAGRYVRLRVRDTGSGIPAKVLDRIFDPFFTTKGVGVGTGLGLSLVHGIVTDLGGGIEVDSRVGEGTTFTVYLPFGGEAPAAKPAEKATARGNGETVLLVDDEEALVRLGEEMIAELGYEPVGFTSSAAALKAFRASPERFNAVLSDETMPEMTGSDLARAIRSIRPDMPVVLMTGFISPALSARARDIGVTDVLAKPLVAADIARSLAGVFNP